MTKEQWRLIGGLAALIGVYAFIKSGKCPPAAALLPMPPDSEFDPVALREGALVELEHTTNRATAKKIAKAHLLEDPDYYPKLASLDL